jgi:hypothetical protein
MKSNIRWMALILLVSLLFFWKIIFTHQFSILTNSEIVNQAYSWYHFCASTIQRGSLPLWDPFTHAGRDLVGGMETGVFYPLKLLIYLWPLNRAHMLSPQLFQDFHVFTHVLAACLLFLLARELGLGGFAAFAASLCFSLGGYVSRIPWPDMLDSAIWLPLVLLFLIRALRSPTLRRTALYTCLAGLALGMTILAGRIHIVLMDVLVVVSAAAYLTVVEKCSPDAPRLRRSAWVRSAVIVTIIGIVSLAFGAVQLLPSLEYSSLAVREIGGSAPVAATEKILYSEMRDYQWPRALLGLLFLTPFPGGSIGGEGLSVYFGILPLLLTVFGVWRNWSNLWVRYLAGLAVLAFFVTLGPYSFLHGLLYAFVPYLWLLRNPQRYMYLMHFAMAILAGFGIQSLFSGRESDAKALASFSRILTRLLIVVSIAVGVPAIYNKPEMNEWIYVSFLFMLASCGLFAYVLRGRSKRAAAFAIVAIILCDFQAGYWSIQVKVPLEKSGADYFEVLQYSRNLAGFLKKQPGLFRVTMSTPEAWPNIADVYAVPVTECTMATELRDFLKFRTTVPHALEFLNVYYIVRPASAGNANPVYSDNLWKVYKNTSNPCPRAWIVHQAAAVSSFDHTLQRMKASDFDYFKTAVVSGPLEAELAPEAEGAQEGVWFESYRPNRLELTAHAQTRGLLVLSEIYFPGWEATVNGRKVRIERVDGVLRGVVIPSGESRVVLRYVPTSVTLGAVVTLLTFFGSCAVYIFIMCSEKAERRNQSG